MFELHHSVDLNKLNDDDDDDNFTVASPGFVARRDKDEALMVDFRAGCSSCSMTNNFMTNAVLIERAVSCLHLHQLIAQTTQYLDSWLSGFTPK